MEEFPVVEPQTAALQLTWPLPPPHLELAAGQFHVWSACLERAQADFPAALAMLSPDEQERSAKFHFERDRQNFVARRSLLRAILARYLKVAPSQIVLSYEERGKPRLAGPDGSAPLHFNFSHARDLALCAVTRLAPLGVDVERFRPMPEMTEIGATFCSVQENARLAAAPPEKKIEVFFSIWTRKEAWLKATGEGIASELAQLDCSHPPSGWSFHPLSPAPGYIGALALPAPAAIPQCWQWPRPT